MFMDPNYEIDTGQRTEIAKLVGNAVVPATNSSSRV